VHDWFDCNVYEKECTVEEILLRESCGIIEHEVPPSYLELVECISPKPNLFIVFSFPYNHLCRPIECYVMFDLVSSWTLWTTCLICLTIMCLILFGHLMPLEATIPSSNLFLYT